MLEEVLIACPYCGESQGVEVEPESVGQRYVDDCRVCCRPMVIAVEGASGTLFVNATRDDE